MTTITEWIEDGSRARRADLFARLWQKMDVGDGNRCWPWKAYRRSGYGIIMAAGATRNATRALWEVLNGPIPEGVHVLHRCDNPPCCNPAHLFLGSHAENMADKRAKGREVFPPRRRGEANAQAKLTAKQVAEIRSAPGLQREIAARFGVSQGHVSAIRRGERWQ